MKISNLDVSQTMQRYECRASVFAMQIKDVHLQYAGCSRSVSYGVLHMDGQVGNLTMPAEFMRKYSVVPGSWLVITSRGDASIVDAESFASDYAHAQAVGL